MNDVVDIIILVFFGVLLANLIANSDVVLAASRALARIWNSNLKNAEGQ